MRLLLALTVFLVFSASAFAQAPTPAHRTKIHAKASPTPAASPSPDSGDVSAGQIGATVAGTVVLIVVIVAVYWIPTMVASAHHHNDRLAIVMVNLFAGWTALGWVIALVWACTGNVRRSPGQVAG